MNKSGRYSAELFEGVRSTIDKTKSNSFDFDAMDLDVFERLADKETLLGLVDKSWISGDHFIKELQSLCFTPFQEQMDWSESFIIKNKRFDSKNKLLNGAVFGSSFGVFKVDNKIVLVHLFSELEGARRLFERGYNSLFVSMERMGELPLTQTGLVKFVEFLKYVKSKYKRDAEKTFREIERGFEYDDEDEWYELVNKFGNGLKKLYAQGLVESVAVNETNGYSANRAGKSLEAEIKNQNEVLDAMAEDINDKKSFFETLMHYIRTKGIDVIEKKVEKTVTDYFYPMAELTKENVESYIDKPLFVIQYNPTYSKVKMGLIYTFKRCISDVNNIDYSAFGFSDDDIEERFNGQYEPIYDNYVDDEFKNVYGAVCFGISDYNMMFSQHPNNLQINLSAKNNIFNPPPQKNQYDWGYYNVQIGFSEDLRLDSRELEYGADISFAPNEQSFRNIIEKVNKFIEVGKQQKWKDEFAEAYGSVNGEYVLKDFSEELR